MKISQNILEFKYDLILKTSYNHKRKGQNAPIVGRRNLQEGTRSRRSLSLSLSKPFMRSKAQRYDKKNIEVKFLLLTFFNKNMTYLKKN